MPLLYGKHFTLGNRRLISCRSFHEIVHTPTDKVGLENWAWPPAIAKLIQCLITRRYCSLDAHSSLDKLRSKSLSIDRISRVVSMQHWAICPNFINLKILTRFMIFTNDASSPIRSINRSLKTNPKYAVTFYSYCEHLLICAKNRHIKITNNDI